MINRNRTTREVLVLTSTEAERQDKQQARAGLEAGLRLAFSEKAADGAVHGKPTAAKKPSHQPAAAIEEPALDHQT